MLDGADLSAQHHQFMCMKAEHRGTTCRPFGHEDTEDIDVCSSYGGTLCHMTHIAEGAGLPGGRPGCMDARGKWQRKVCKRKARKNKCGKPKIKTKCPATCGLCG